MMEDYNALNQESEIAQKHTEERTRKEINMSVSNEIRNQFEIQGKEDKKHTANATGSNPPPHSTT